jgi:uncharacterized membrane protein YqjE
MSNGPYRDDPGTVELRPQEPDVPLGELFGRLGHDLSELVTAQADLARREIRDEVSSATRAATAVAGAVVVGLVALILLALAAAWGLDEVWPAWLAHLAVGLVLAAVAGALYLVGRNRLQATDMVPRTKQTLKEDAEWTRQRMH